MQAERRSSYREYGVSGVLAGHLVCFWSQTITHDGPPGSHTILPDACADIVLVSGAAPVVAGPATLPVEPRLPKGARVVGARFRPGAAPSWLGVPASAMLNLDVDLRDLWGPEVLRLVDLAAGAASVDERLELLQEFLTARLDAVQATDPAVDAAVRALAGPTPPSVRHLAQALGLGERQLLRRFKDRLGYGPKMLQRILRLQRLLRLAATTPREDATRTLPHASLAALAFDAGYADQAHMARDVRELAGATPRALLHRHSGTLGLSDLFNTAAHRAL